MNCPDCTAENMEGAASCWKCGTALKVAEPKSPTTWVVWAVLGVAVFVLVALMMMSNRPIGGGSSSGLPPSVAPTSGVGGKSPAATQTAAPGNSSAAKTPKSAGKK